MFKVNCHKVTNDFIQSSKEICTKIHEFRKYNLNLFPVQQELFGLKLRNNCSLSPTIVKFLKYTIKQYITKFNNTRTASKSIT